MIMRFQRRQRTTFTKEQLEALQDAFKKTHYPEADLRELLSRSTKLSPSRIQVWFQNQRAKDKKRRCLLGLPSSSQANSPSESNQNNQLTFQSQDIRIENATRNYDFSSNGNITNTQEEDSTHRTRNELRVTKSSKSSRQNDNPNQQRHIYLFTSCMANEAALAVRAGKYTSILEYHREKYRNISI